VRSVWFVARTEIAHQMRRRETLLWVFVMPIVFFYFIGTVTGGLGIEPSARRDRLALRAPADGGFLVDELVRRLEAQQFVVERPAAGAEFDRYTRRLTVPAPADGTTFTAAVLAGEPQTLDYRSRTEGPGADYERIRVGRAVYSLLADLAVAGETEPVPDAAGVRAVATAPRSLRLEVTSAGRRLEPPSGYAQTIPGTMVMFTMLVLLTGGAISLVVEREQGLLRRLASTPISRGTVVAGKWIGKLLLGLVQIGFAMIAGTVLFHMDWGGSLPMVLVVLFGWAAFCASLGFLLGNLARTPAQMAGGGVMATLVLAALGGCWWPIEITPRWMQYVALALPTGWAMDAMHKLISFGDGPASVLPHLTAIFAAVVVLGVASVRTFRYQ
jgi:ABC-2 type transport system permease protein